MRFPGIDVFFILRALSPAASGASARWSGQADLGMFDRARVCVMALLQ